MTPITATPAPFAPDWYIVGLPQVQSIAKTPGLRYDDRRNVWIVHRSHLPILNLDSPVQPSELPASSPIFGDGETKLRPHQVESMNFIRSRRGTLLADMMRLGKTPAVIASHDPDLGRLVVVGPLQTRHVWLSWMKRRWPREIPVVLTGKSYDRDRLDDAKLVFIHYDVLSAWVSIGIRKRVGTLVFDEAHALANRNSKRSTAACEMSPAAERTICATGTPLWNAPESIYGVLRTCNPGAWGTYFAFTERYASGKPGSHGWTTGGPTETLEFQDRLREVMIRRVWSDVMDALPPIARTVDKVTLTGSQRRNLDLIAADLGSATDTPTVVGEMARYRGILATIKAERAAEIALAKSSHGPVVVWTWHRKASKAIREHIEFGVPCWIVDGSIPDADERETILDRWRETSDGVLIMSIAVGQAGIDLSHSRQAIFAELDWTPAVIGQAEMRTFAPNRDSEVVYVVADHDVDEKLAAVLAKKCEQAITMGVPAADTAIEVIGQILNNDNLVANLDGLASRIASQVQIEGTTLE
jgi:SNF2 family DNA or RNA helicase